MLPRRSEQYGLSLSDVFSKEIYEELRQTKPGEWFQFNLVSRKIEHKEWLDVDDVNHYVTYGVIREPRCLSQAIVRVNDFFTILFDYGELKKPYEEFVQDLIREIGE